MEEYLILSVKWSRRDSDWLVWWRHHGFGYTTNIAAAGRFSQAEAERNERASRGEVLAVPLKQALALAETRVMVHDTKLELLAD